MNKQLLIMKRGDFVGLLTRYLAILIMLVFTSTALCADLDILVIGSSHSYSEGGESGVVQEKAFNPSNIATQLNSILSNDPAITDTVNVVVEDIYRSKQVDTAMGSGGALWDFTYRCYSLAQYYMWPDGKAARLANLRGETTAWDYVIIMGDPYLMANMPGVYAEGIKLLATEISSGTAEPILLAQWPENSSTFTATQFNEIVYRVGTSAGLRVVPAGKAWDTMSGQDTSSNHPTPKGAYLAASCIYSELYDKNAKTSSYNYNDAIADHALSVVQANDGVSQYTGTYTSVNPFQMKYFKGRTIDWCEYGSSTEEGFANGLKAAFPIAGINNSRRTGTSGDPVDFSYSRGTDCFEADKQYDYQTRLDNDNWTYGFPIGDHSATGPTTMLYGIDKRYYANSSFYNGTDLGIAYSMIRENQVPINVRGTPVRLLWAKMNHANHGMSSHRDSWHLSNELDRAVGAYMYTMVSGRCPIEEEPADDTSTEWKQWLCRKIGYETAWQMSHLTARAPGFRVLPSATTALTVTPGTTETMTVKFIYSPQSPVTVSIAPNVTSAAIVNPKTLSFDETNHGTARDVRVVGIPGVSSAENFNVEYTTTSNDKVYSGLSDSWEYTNNRAATEALTVVNQTDRQETAPKNGSKTIDLQVAGSVESNTVLAVPFHGTLSWSGPNVVYTPDTDYLGNDTFAFAVNTGGNITRGYIEITVEDVPEVKIVETGGSTDVVEGGATDTYTVFLDEAPAANVTVTISTDSQVSVSPTSLTFTTGDWSDPQTVTVTAVNDGTHELIHNGTVSHTTSSSDSSWDGIQVNNVAATITDDDNQLPVVDAGTNQTVTLDLSENWTPAEIATYSWYDANDAPTIIESGGAVSQWNDKSGNNKNATQSNGAKQPTTGTRTIGGLNALNFDATEDFDVPSFDLVGKECWTVINKDTADDFHVLGSSGNVQVGVLSSGKMRIWPSFSSDTQSTTLISVGSDYFLGFRAVNPKTYSINGTEEATTNTPTGALTINHIMENQYAHNSDGLIGEIIITAGELTTEERQRMEGYLAWKWGMEANLPVAHPHKDATPGNPGVIVNLDGNVSDPDTDPLTTTWSLFSGPNGATVTFGDASAVDTTALFTETGTYVLRLTANDTIDQSYDEVTITVNEPNSLPAVSVTASDATATEEGTTTGTYTISRTGDTTGTLDVLFSLSGSATEATDYSLDATSPVTIPSGQSSVVVTLTPVDDGDKEPNETATLTITSDAAYTVGTASADITIPANDNSAPVVNAGPDQTVYMGQSAPWAPSELSPELWLDADDETTVILNGGTVQQWNDKSGNGRNATQATATSQPTDTADGLNGKHVLTFDGNSDYFGVDLDFMAGVDHSTFIVTKPTTYTDIYGAANASAGANSLHVGFSSASSYRMNYWSNDWNGTVSANFQAGAANILNYIWTSGTSKQIFANGKSEGTNGSAGVIGTMSGGGRIGAVVNHGNYGGDIAEFIVFSSPLSQADREKMEGYLAHKWGLEGSLPVDHPYKDEAPGAPSATATLDGTVTDVDGDTPTTTWTKFSGPGTVTFDDDSTIDTNANFDTSGIYVLRLTADDGIDQTFDEITITIETLTPHAADTNSDWSISQAEVNSFISNYGSNNNSITGDVGSITDGRITMREVLRVIYLYNDGGAYIGGQASVDGFDIAGAPSDPAETTPASTEGPGNQSFDNIVVSSTADSGVGSLRNAIAIATDGETIKIDESLDTIILLSEIVIDKSITIDGQGSAIVSGGRQTRIFRIENAERDIIVTIMNMGIVDANNANNEFGGAVYNNAQTLNFSTILFDSNTNTAENGKGGAVYSSGTLNVDNCVFQNNTASENEDVYDE